MTERGERTGAEKRSGKEQKNPHETNKQINKQSSSKAVKKSATGKPPAGKKTSVSKKTAAPKAQLRSKSATKKRTAPRELRKTKTVRVIAIGASAGGLEPIEKFFDSMPTDSGLALVIVQHLSPDFRSMMDQLLSRHSTMTIQHAEDGMAVKANVVYLNPPRAETTISNGKLKIAEIADPTTLSLPIDTFFTSLAEDQKENAVGIVMSGTGSDGTRGGQAILSAGGTMIVQEPSSAKFDSMPRSAIEHGATTLTALPGEMPEVISRLLDGYDVRNTDTPKSNDPERRILALLQRRYGADFGYYKRSTVGRRIHRRALLNQMSDVSEYADILASDGDELEALYCDLLIGVTAFFRDKEAFDNLRKRVIPDLVSVMSADRTLRIWAAGCASGEEPYSLAILISEYAREHQLTLNLKIFATDLHFKSLEAASNGIYSADNLKGMSNDVLDRYFERIDDEFHVKSSLRQLIVFTPHNLIKDPPFTRIDLITCRNLLIYLDDVAQKKVLGLFHFALRKDGALFLGPSETTGELEKEFKVIDTRWRIFRKIRDITLRESTHLLPLRSNDDVQFSEPMRLGESNLSSFQEVHAVTARRRMLLHAYDEVLRKHAPPAILVDREGEIIHIFGDAERYIELKSGLFSNKIVDMLHQDLKLMVGSGLERALAPHAAPTQRKCQVKLDDEETATIIVSIDNLEADSAGSDYLLVTFQEQKSVPLPDLSEDIGQRVDHEFYLKRINELERDLKVSDESLQSTIEELETSNEELQATNEELMASNEELQSTNEELHSVNEELYTVSSEHQRKIEELTEITEDMDNLLRATDIGTIFLDTELQVRRFTPAATRAFNLVSHDVGRPLQHVTYRFSHDTLIDEIKSVSVTGVTRDYEIIVEDTTFLLRIIPYRSDTDQTSGTALMVVDIQELTSAREELIQQYEELSRVNENLNQFTHIVSHDLSAPLRAIHHTTNWIEEDMGEDANEEVLNHIERLRGQVGVMSGMLSDLLDYSRAGSSEHEAEAIDLMKVLRDMIGVLDKPQGMAVEIESVPDQLVTLRTPIALVFRNLIENAVKYHDRDHGIITIRTEDAGDQWVFSVEDDGPGIDPKFHNKILLPFRKLERKDSAPGNGMGLALVKKAVEANGGKLTIISSPAEKPGTIFQFSWPKNEGHMTIAA